MINESETALFTIQKLTLGTDRIALNGYFVTEQVAEDRKLNVGWLRKDKQIRNAQGRTSPTSAWPSRSEGSIISYAFIVLAGVCSLIGLLGLLVALGELGIFKRLFGGNADACTFLNIAIFLLFSSSSCIW